MKKPITKDDLLPPKSARERKSEITHRAATTIINAETAARKKKTERLRKLRLKRGKA